MGSVIFPPPPLSLMMKKKALIMIFNFSQTKNLSSWTPLPVALKILSPSLLVLPLTSDPFDPSDPFPFILLEEAFCFLILSPPLPDLLFLREMHAS